MRVVNVDGACLRNGQHGASAGIGVYWGPGSPLNMSKVVDGEKHTNQVAEIQAATAAIILAYHEKFHDLKICTDSMFVINGATDWINNKWKRNGWRNSRGRILENKEDWEKLDIVIVVYERMRGKITWEHVPAHQGHYGNEQADTLAKKAAQGRPYACQFDNCIAKSITMMVAQLHAHVCT